MSLDGRLLARAKLALEAKRREHEEEYARRIEEVYDRCPQVRELDDELSSLMAEVIGVALASGGDPGEAVEEIGERSMRLSAERSLTIARAGFAPGYIDGEYMCQSCRDTGYAGTEICSCLMELYKAEQKSSLSSLLKLGGETFDSFDLALYSDVPDKNTGISPRRNMEFVYEACVEYARKFGRRSFNLFLNGAPGLGKTFLSACIARVVAELGYSVVYDMASCIFSKFEDDKFSRGEDPAAARRETRRYLECDLLIMDDLGTEMTTAFTVSALYEIINTRLITGKKTVISSNLSLADLRRRYSPQIMSRLEGEYQVLPFYGDDIRLKNKI